MLENKKVLIVGGTGFIGMHIARKALEYGFDVTIISKKQKDCESLDSVEYITADVSQKNNLLIQLKGKLFNYVVNVGGYIDHANYFNGGNSVFDVHFNGVRNLVDCIDRSELITFVQIGSSDEYGGNLAPQFETQREAPISPYSCAKVASTHFLQTLFITEKFPAVILRLFLVYGPGQGKERFLPQIIKGCVHNQKFPASKGEQLRDFCFIDDFVQAVFSTLDNDNAYGEVINISSGESTSIKKIVDMVVNIIGFGQPQFGQIAYRDGENMALYANIDKAEKLLGWRPGTSLEKGLAETIKWMKGQL
jgi:nucleoside-diphosphate-sugar epimerase